MNALLTQSFPITTLRVQTAALSALTLPEYAGSALRGILGHELRALACVTGAPSCDARPLRQTCAYTEVFEGVAPADAERTYSNIPNGFVLAAPLHSAAQPLQRGDHFEFKLTLIGRARRHAPLVRQALARGMAQRLGAWGGGLTLLSSAAEPVPAATLPPDARRLRIELLTPLYLKRQGEPLRPQQLQARDFLNALIRRVGDLLALQLGQGPAWREPASALRQAAEAIQAHNADLRWHSIKRWSNRQHSEMQLCGLLGSFELSGPWQPLAELLQLGQTLHIGGKTSFGLGRYTVTSCQDKTL
ncbi:CRISPR system precrRNA processing endoribonuclease RAMP protein Cas6 [Roseateles sp.]|uniref:CRISPR system precrRNA processing endoribonuclease RAMP protein Cas6 n=1 Tax=Roseateles sp. TaxID=1971397 RepID=UPI00286BC6CF|nr:CRISPR system precrRNA processing endoribonuclease RAMP protein Cas6 [Roseateles sp.]